MNSENWIRISYLFFLTEISKCHSISNAKKGDTL